MKKTIALLLTILLLFVLAGCDGILKPSAPSPEPTPTATAAPTPAPTPTPKPTVTMPLSSEEFLGYSCLEAEQKLRILGFDSIRLSEYADLTSGEAEKVETVYSIAIAGNDAFTVGDKFPADAEVVLQYHVVRKASIPLSPEELQGKEATELAAIFEEAGFINVRTDVASDLTQEEAASGPVIETLVNRSASFSKNDKLPFDTEILILTHVYGGSHTDLQELTPEQIYARCAPAVFYIEIYDEYGWCIKTGSGFFLTSDGLAITNYHVISGAASASITVSDTGMVYDVAGVYDYSMDEDWAVLQIDGSGFQTLEIGDPGYNVGGATVYAIGSPLGLQNTISQGIISNPARIDGGMKYIQMSAAISHGSSGGALLNKYGQVIGITSATYTDGQNLNLSIPMTYLENMDISSYRPLREAQSSPSGTLTLSQYQLSMGVGETAAVTVTAIEQNCPDTVSVRFIIGDTDIVSCSWGGWVGDDNTLNVESQKIGSTQVTVYFLISGSETVLDVKTLSVTVTAEGGQPQGGDDSTEFYTDTDDLLLGLFGSGVITVHARSDMDMDEVNWASVSYYVGDTSIVSCSWGDWEGDDVCLYVTPLSAGSTDITIVYHLEDGTVLASQLVNVTVFYAALELSEYEVCLQQGEACTVDVTIRSDNPGLHTLRFVIYGEDVVSCSWGAWYEDNITIPLTINGLQAGEADVEILLLDKVSEQFLYSVSIPVIVE